MKIDSNDIIEVDAVGVKLFFYLTITFPCWGPFFGFHWHLFPGMRLSSGPSWPAPSNFGLPPICLPLPPNLHGIASLLLGLAKFGFTEKPL